MAVAGVGVVELGHQQLDCRAGEVVLELGGDQRTSAGLRVQLQQLRARVGLENVTHADGPDAPAHATEDEVFDVQPAIEEERKSRAKLVNVQAAGFEHVRVGK